MWDFWEHFLDYILVSLGNVGLREHFLDYILVSSSTN